jgi:hypothetical protein
MVELPLKSRHIRRQFLARRRLVDDAPSLFQPGIQFVQARLRVPLPPGRAR